MGSLFLLKTAVTAFALTAGANYAMGSYNKAHDRADIVDSMHDAAEQIAKSHTLPLLKDLKFNGLSFAELEQKSLSLNTSEDENEE